MQEALKNPQFKKIWETVIMNRHPEAKSLEEALEMESQKNGCILYDVDSKRYFTVFECNYTDDESISLQCISDTGGSTVITYKKANSKQEILGRPITLFDVISLLNKNKDEEEDPLYYANGKRIFAIFCDESYCRKVCDFNTNLLEEQTPETWEKIANLI